MGTREIATSDFPELIKSGMVLIDWWASWCGPCRAFAPIYEAAWRQHADVVFAKVDTDAQPALAAAFHIRAIPTLMAFRDGILLYREAGVLSGRALDELIQHIRHLDMHDVTKKIAEVEAKEGKGARFADKGRAP